MKSNLFDIDFIRIHFLHMNIPKSKNFWILQGSNVQNKLWILFCLVFLVGKIAFTFLQHKDSILDGDMPGGILPSSELDMLWANPLGISTILSDTTYANPNRFFSHWTFYHYFNLVPAKLQLWFDPIDSVYISCAIIKTFAQLCLIILLSMAVCSQFKSSKSFLLIAAMIITPLFQTNGFQSRMGIIDPSVSYLFFYGMPIIFVILYFIPAFLSWHNRNVFRPGRYLILYLVVVALFSAFSGPLNSGVALILSLLILWRDNESVKLVGKNGLSQKWQSISQIFCRNYWLLPIVLLSAYSLLLGTHNSINAANPHHLWDLYKQLPQGLFYLLTEKIAWLVLIFSIIVLYLFVHSNVGEDQRLKLKITVKFILAFSIFYLLLLPLGGFRPYRPHIIRYDTFLPITLASIFLLSMLAYHALFIHHSGYSNLIRMYVLGLVLFFTISDAKITQQNKCQRMMLSKLRETRSPVVQLSQECTILSWSQIQNSTESLSQARLINRWGITDSLRLFEQVRD